MTNHPPNWRSFWTAAVLCRFRTPESRAAFWVSRGKSGRGLPHCKTWRQVERFCNDFNRFINGYFKVFK
jgi:hypothetical protein